MARENEAAKLVGDREMSITRVLNAPRELVFKVFTDQDHLAKWWGPNGFTITTASMDVRVGGQWRFVMHGPDGRDYPSLVTYLEISPPGKLVFKHGGTVDEGPVNHTTTATFEEAGPGKTKLIFTLRFASPEAREFVIKTYGALEGCTQTIGRLSEYLEEGAGEDAPFVLTRELDAPREKVFAAWTQPEHLAKWFGPKGTSLTVHKLEMRPGGVFLYAMRGPQGPEMWGKWVFREIVAPEKLVVIASFSDANGGLTRHPMSATWPLETLSTTTFEAIGNRTRMTLRWRPINATPEERKTFAAGRASMEQGWGGTMEQLVAHLAQG